MSSYQNKLGENRKSTKQGFELLKEYKKDLKPYIKEIQLNLVFSVLIAISVMISLVVLQFKDLYDFEECFAVLPMIIGEAVVMMFRVYFLLVFNFSRFKQTRVIMSLLDLQFWVSILIMVKSNHLNLMSVLSVIWIIKLTVMCLYPKNDTSRIVKILISVENSISLGIAISLLSIGLKISNFIDFTWPVVFLPVWCTLFLLFVIFCISVLLTFKSAVNYCNQKEPVSFLYCSLWLSCSVIFLVISITLLFVSYINSFKEIIYYPFIIYLFLFSLLTCYMINSISEWILFHLFLETIVSRKRLRKVNLNQTGKNELPPLVIEEIAHGYFKPKNLDRPIRTQSISGFADINSFHFRSASNGIDCKEELENTQKMTEKNCIICYDNSSNSVVMPCGHGGICFSCSKRLIRGKKNCHICRSPFERVLKIEEDSSSALRVIGVKINKNRK